MTASSSHRTGEFRATSETRKAKIDFVSPLPPVRSGIADYSADLLPHLEQECDLRVVAVPQQEIAEPLLERFSPVPFERLGEDGRLPLYQVGNNAYHAAIVERARRAPGVVTLHDFVLHHLLQERTLKDGDLDGYVRALVEDHGWIGGAVSLVPRWHGYGKVAVFALPANRSLLERQRGVLVHSEWARRALREEGVATEVAVVPMPMPVPTASSRAISREASAEFRRRHDLAPGALVVGSFGFQTPIKRTDVVLRALAASGIEEAVLVVGGASSPAIDLVEIARDLGIAERVRFTGFLEAEEYAAAVAACDLCVNLRYPSAGETSAALLRVAALGLPVLVSAHAQFAELPREIATQIPVDDEQPDREIGALVDALRRGVENREALAAAGAQARSYVERHHDPGAVARTMARTIAEWGEEATSLTGAADRTASRSSLCPRAACPRPTSLTWGRFEGALEVRGLDGWSPGERRELEIELSNASFSRWLAAARGPGGVALEVELAAEDGAREQVPWLALPVDLEPLGSWRFRLRLRRPLGRSRLRIEPHVDGLGGFSSLGGPVWDELLAEQESTDRAEAEARA